MTVQQIKNYEWAVDFLFNRINYETSRRQSFNADENKLERMKVLLEALGNPQESLPTIHIAGTKGKGSSAGMISAILSAAGHKTGLFTSPHINVFEERMTVDGKTPTAEQVVSLTKRLESACNRLKQRNPEFEPTFFELMTAMAWLFFAEHHVDFVVLEVGLGGRLDSTNVCTPLACLITNISYDHVPLLGTTLAEIATEKAGIIKQGVPVFSGVTDQSAREVIQTMSADKRASLTQIGEDFQYEYCPSSHFSSRNDSALWQIEHSFVDVHAAKRDWMKIALKTPGEHQARNCALSLSLIDYLKTSGVSISDESVYSALSEWSLPLRVEVLFNNPTFIVDAAHNVASTQALLETIAEKGPFRKKTLIFASSKGKDTFEMLEQLVPKFDLFILTEYKKNSRSVPVKQLEQTFLKVTSKPYEITQTPRESQQRALENYHQDDLICATGSFFVAAEIRELVLATHPATCPNP